MVTRKCDRCRKNITDIGIQHIDISDGRMHPMMRMKLCKDCTREAMEALRRWAYDECRKGNPGKGKEGV